MTRAVDVYIWRMYPKILIWCDRIKEESYIAAALSAITGLHLLERLRLIQGFSFAYSGIVLLFARTGGLL